jgi:transketolase C-terminal domain/subunit
MAHCGLAEYDDTRLYMPADALQLKSLVETIWGDKGLRFLFTTRSKVPYILKEDGEKYYGDSYQFVPGMDEVIREGSAGYVVSYGEMLHRALDAVERARKEGIDVGLINKPTLNIVDETTMKKVGAAPFVLVVEGQNLNTGLGMRYGTWLLERGFSPQYGVMAVTRPGKGGTSEQVPHQGLAPDDILKKIQGMA